MKIAIALLIASVSFSGTTLGMNLVPNGDFESPGLDLDSSLLLGDGATIPGWTAIQNSLNNEPAYLVHESRWAGKAIDASQNQALVLNAGSGVMTTIPLSLGETYHLSLLGFGAYVTPLVIEIGSFKTSLTFEHWMVGGFQERSFTFTALESDPDAVLKLYNADPRSDTRQWTVDNLQVSRVPDGGATAVLMGLGVLGVASLKRMFSMK